MLQVHVTINKIPKNKVYNKILVRRNSTLMWINKGNEINAYLKAWSHRDTSLWIFKRVY